MILKGQYLSCLIFTDKAEVFFYRKPQNRLAETWEGIALGLGKERKSAKLSVEAFAYFST
jgi:hypothetical protein